MLHSIFRSPPVKLLALAAAYYVSGRLGLALTIPPGHATAIWPASGIALAGLLLLGARYWPAIFLGAMGTSLYHPDVIDAQALAIAASIATGASLQALLGRTLVRRQLLGDYGLRSVGDIMRLIVFGGLISCLLNAVVGTATLHYVGFVPAAAIPLHWFTWWAGDVIGVLVFTPLLLLLFAPRHSTRRARQVVVGTSLLFVFTLVIILFGLAKEQDEAERQMAFKGLTARVTQEIERDLAVYANVLSAVDGFIASSESLEYDDFRRFTGGFLDEYPGIRTLSWNRRVPHAERVGFESRVRSLGFADYAIRDRGEGGEMEIAPPREVYFPTTYLAPLEGNERAHGFDTYGEEVRRRVMHRAVELDAAIATDRLAIVQAEQEYGLIVYRPVFADAGSLDGIPSERSLRGFTAGVFVFPRMMAAARELAERLDLQFALLDGGGDEPTLLYDSTTPDFKEPTEAAWVPPGQLTGSQAVDFGGRRWTIRFAQDPRAYAGQHDWALWAVLIGGMGFVGLVGMLLMTMTARTEAIERIVERRTAELEEARLRAEEATRAKSDFLSNMSHELRTPMNSIIAFTKLVMKKHRGELAPRALDSLQIVDRNALHLLDLINELLDVSKIEAGRMTLDRSTIDLTPIVRETVETLAPLAESRNLTLETEADDEPVLLLGDRTKIKQVLINLVSNGVKYTDRGSVTITVHAEPSEAGAGTARITVKDTGIGMKPDELERLFTHYMQFDSAGQRRVGGTGLGLVIAKAYVEMHGGRIDVSSEYRQGTEFLVELPLAPEGTHA